MHRSRRLRFALASGVVLGLAITLLADLSPGRPDAPQVDEPFRGVTTNGTVTTGLFPIRASGVSTAPLREAADRFLASLTPEQRDGTTFPVTDDEWRLWNNIHRYDRQGVSFEEMTEEQRQRAFEMMRAGLSVKGFEASRNVMRLNGHLTELVDRPGEYGEWLYHITVMGQPSGTEPWGWQLDGHHLIINYFVLGDQVVMTPTFMGSEPVRAESGPYAGIEVLQDEQRKGFAFMESLRPEQQSVAIIDSSKTRNNALAQAWNDNLVLDYAGLRATQMDDVQRTLLLDVIAEYVNNMDEGHARVRMEEVRQHLDATYFAWVGGTGPDAAFYYRIQSPVILIEFDHQSPVALPGPRVPGRRHVHTVVRTPNGNDYGKDLLRQHLERFRNDPTHGHNH